MSENDKDAKVQKKKPMGQLEDRISSVDRYLVKILIAGLLISIMVMILGGLFFLITQFIPELGWSLFISLPAGLQVAVAGALIFILFGLLTLFNILWKRGYFVLLRWFYSVTED